MNYNKWKDRINSLNIREDVMDKVITLFSKYSHQDSFAFIQVDDNELLKSFNNVNNYKPLTICLDIEFQSAIVKGTKYIHTDSVHKEKAARFIRELGMIVFITDKDKKVYYLGHIFVNFKELTEFKGFHPKNIRLISARYATVTDNTYDKMNKLEEMFHVENIIDLLDPSKVKDQFRNDDKFKQLVKRISTQIYQNYLFERILDNKIQENVKESFGHLMKAQNLDEAMEEIRYIKKQLTKIQFDVYAKFLDKSTLQNFQKINRYYWSDPLVKERVRLMHNKYKHFMELFEELSNESILVVKGKMDIIAIKNMAKIIVPYLDFYLENTYDIETFNGFSKTHYNSSQLEQTYLALTKTKVYKGPAKTLFDQILLTVGDKAHNPVVDSLFTIIVAIAVNLGLNEYYGKIDKVQRGGYYDQYMKYKDQYLELKRINEN